ncbi:hypothetical protein LBBP_02817 [Leptospira borgpetersenii serovar Ballum]|uniref:Uncharacterized protein n=1 Tax=Leptospira borgpetersenii serovar Ballum TaxID=280505 RepID=A0A0S2ITQ5_LEPBO|nr:hypothetical protein LBBP_02817 [Leptospira borgpetersenii serovar Ballum]
MVDSRIVDNYNGHTFLKLYSGKLFSMVRGTFKHESNI